VLRRSAVDCRDDTTEFVARRALGIFSTDELDLLPLPIEDDDARMSSLFCMAIHSLTALVGDGA